MKRLFVNRVLPVVLCGIFYLWCFTIRSRNKNPEGEKYFKNRTYILTLWHSRIFYLFYHFRRQDYQLLISPSKDGDWLANLAGLMGYSVIRGSSYKKAVPAARSLIKLLRRNQRIIIVADGSRGPRHKAQPGSVQLASMTGVPVIPITYDADHRIELSSWDRFVLPLPFTRCTVNFGPPIDVPHKADEAVILEKQNELESALNQITEECF